jgi:hypothetical protein
MTSPSFWLNNGMPTDIKNIINNVKDIYMTKSSLDTLLDYERVLDQLDLYTFANWKKGELVEGPVYEKYFVTCRWMYGYRQMPDPAGAERLLGYGCEVTYQEDEIIEPLPIDNPDDFVAGTRVAKKVSRPIWIVSITMPKKLMSDIQQGSIELENETLEAEDIDVVDEEGLDELEADQSMQDNIDQNAQPQQLPPQPPPAI